VSIKEDYEEADAWGLSSNIDLYDCEPGLIRDAEYIRCFVYKLCDYLGMKRFGDCTVVHFGEKEEIAGYSMTQLIETSLISGHFANKTNAVYLDVFSCKFYDPALAAEMAKEYFKGKDVRVRYTLRK